MPCLPDHERMAQTLLDSFSTSETLCTTGEATEKAKREWAAHWHGPATVIGLQHKSLWLAPRTTTVKCSKGHVRHATASEQLLHFVHRGCHLVVLCKLQKICSWTSMKPHRNAHVTRLAALNSLISPIPMGLCRELKTSVFRCQELLSNTCQLRRPLFSQCHMETLHLLHHRCCAATKRCVRRHHFTVFQEERQRL